MFYLTTQLNTFNLRLYGVGHMVKDHSQREKKPAAVTWATLSEQQQRLFYMHHETGRLAHTMIFVTPVVEHWLKRERAQWVHHEGTLLSQIKSIRFNVHIQRKLLQHTPVMGTHSSYQLCCLSRTVCQQLVVTLIEVSEKEEGVVALHLPALGLNRYRDANPVPTSPFSDDIAIGAGANDLTTRTLLSHSLHTHTHTHTHTHRVVACPEKLGGWGGRVTK